MRSAAAARQVPPSACPPPPPAQRRSTPHPGHPHSALLLPSCLPLGSTAARVCVVRHSSTVTEAAGAGQKHQTPNERSRERASGNGHPASAAHTAWGAQSASPATSAVSISPPAAMLAITSATSPQAAPRSCVGGGARRPAAAAAKPAPLWRCLAQPASSQAREDTELAGWRPRGRLHSCASAADAASTALPMCPVCTRSGAAALPTLVALTGCGPY